MHYHLSDEFQVHTISWRTVVTLTEETYMPVRNVARKFLSTKELSSLLDIPEGTLRQWRSSGVGPKWFKLRGSVRYDREHVDLFIHESERSPSVRAITEDHLVSVSTAR